MRGIRPHRLVTRFAIGGLVAFLAVGLALSVTIAHQFRDRGEEQAAAHAVFVTDSIIQYEVTASDLRRPVTDPARYRQLLKFVQDRILRGDGASPFAVVRLKIWSKNGTVVFSDEPRLVGVQLPLDDDLREAMSGHVVAGVSNLTATENIYERLLADKLFETYVPLRLGPHGSGPADAVAELYQNYGPIQRQIDGGFRTVALSLLCGLAALYLLLLPIVLRASRTLSDQNVRLEDQASRLEELLRREKHTVAELRELNRLKSNFVAIASHELRTPLTSIIGYAKMLRQPQFAAAGTERDEFLQAIERQGDRLFQLVENLLTTSHLEDSVKVSVSTFSFEELIRDVVEGLGAAGKRVRVTVPPNLPPLLTDRQFVAQILQNLLSNALKFSSANCDLGAGVDSRTLVFWVRDLGIGITPEELPKIFDRFYQVDSSSTRRYGGIGLGLSLVRTLVDALEGSIEVESRPDQGTTFTVTLPLIHPSPAAHDDAMSELEGAGSEPVEQPAEDGRPHQMAGQPA